MTNKLTTSRDAPASSESDQGFNLVELVIAVSLVGLITTVLAAAIVVSLRSIPDTESRLDDARATRALATWLSHDTTSAPRFLPEQAQGGINLTTADTGDNNDCGGEGTNLLHLQWTEDSFVDTTHVANYRFVIDGEGGAIRRYACSALGTGPFSISADRMLTSGLDPTQLPVVVPEPATGEVVALTFQLAGKSGENVAIETGSRNPADFFP
jgi:prepilin-type N-terminal cleavage/methylation domain-containing protein